MFAFFRPSASGLEDSPAKFSAPVSHWLFILVYCCCGVDCSLRIDCVIVLVRLRLVSDSLLCLLLLTGEEFYKYSDAYDFRIVEGESKHLTYLLESIILSFGEHYSLWFLRSFCHGFEASS